MSTSTPIAPPSITPAYTKAMADAYCEYPVGTTQDLLASLALAGHPEAQRLVADMWAKDNAQYACVPPPDFPRS